MSTDVAALLEGSGWLLTYGAIFLGGLALNLTPCVYPLIPITVSFFAGRGEHRKAHAVGLSLLYVLGIAMTYSAIGVAAALSGQMLGFLLQKPLVLLMFSELMVVLALSQFGLFELRAASFLVSRHREGSETLQALSMGLVAGIVAAPCIGPFVLGLLLYVGHTRDPFTGFTMFLTLALGLGFPYFILGLFTGALKSLPRSGDWMVGVKKVFGFVLLALALSFVEPLLGERLYSYGLAALALAAFGTFVVRYALRKGRVGRVVATGAALVGLLAFGVMSQTSVPAPDWVPYSASALEGAAAAGKPVVIDFYADWCLPCKEMDLVTFSQAEVLEAAGRMVMIKADVTLETMKATREAVPRFGVEGVPTVVFLDGEGREREDLRLGSFVRAPDMLARMRALESDGRGGGG